MHFDFHSEARTELQETVVYYDAHVPGLGARFIVELDRCIQLLLDAPEIGTPLGRKARRFVLGDGFPYSIIYTVVDAVLYIVAIAHSSRRPGFWRLRIVEQ